MLSTNWREREHSSFVFFWSLSRSHRGPAIRCIAKSPHPSASMLPGFCFVFLSDLITSVYICRAAPCFPSLFVCLCGRGLVRANRHTLSATLGLGVLPSCLKSNQARTRLLACSSWASLRMVFSFFLLKLISTRTLDKSIMNQLAQLTRRKTKDHSSPLKSKHRSRHLAVLHVAL